MSKSRTRSPRLLLFFLCALLGVAPLRSQTVDPAATSLTPGPKPTDAPLEWKQLVGIYRHDQHSAVILESQGRLFWQALVGSESTDFSESAIRFHTTERGTLYLSRLSLIIELLSIRRDDAGSVTDISLGQERFCRVDAGADPAHFFHVTPTKPVEEVRAAALAAKPPEEAGPFRNPQLVELITLDPAIHLDIRYAHSNNFLSKPLYTQARAFMQRPAAEALLRVLQKLQPLGYGLLIHDAYRPWYVTKLFWDATPPEDHSFVADPQKGSKHNRGCAVDLTLYDLKTGETIEMPGLYDEMSPRSFPTFPGGTSLQRWHRDLLRRGMESEGFTVDQNEWWHFDYKAWKLYPILNVPFEKLDKMAN